MRAGDASGIVPVEQRAVALPTLAGQACREFDRAAAVDARAGGFGQGQQAMQGRMTKSAGAGKLAAHARMRDGRRPRVPGGMDPVDVAPPGGLIGQHALALRGVEVGQQQRQLDVLLRGQHRHQVVELEHEADVVAAPGRQLAAAHLVDALAFDADLAAAGVVQAADQVEQGGLARTGGAHQRDEVAARDVQGDAVQHLHFLGATLVGLGDVAQ
ncbi:hypothetical protein G6F59_014324 [Rhizopus arrhizus]|nr:hypothetical protein G6F59_014324 [Rhizopus arrhizus]